MRKVAATGTPEKVGEACIIGKILVRIGRDGYDGSKER
jgi:hypothetical protein